MRGDAYRAGMSIPSFPGTDTSIPEPPVASEHLARRFPSYPDRFTFEPSSRWVRGVADELAVVDSRHQILVWEPGAKVPEYAFPLAHVRVDLLDPIAGQPEEAARYWRPRAQEVQWYDLVLPGRRIPAAAWQWSVPGLEGYLSVSWYPGVLDAWFEEEEPVITHPRDPGNRVDVVSSSRHIEVDYRGRRIADSTDPVLVFENGLPTRFYLPEADIDWGELEPVDVTSTCPYKGVADRYWRAAGGTEEIAWSYSKPFRQLEPVAGRIAFYNERVNLTVDGTPFLDSRRTWA